MQSQLEPYFSKTSNLTKTKQILGADAQTNYLENSKVLIAGAGGLGCELLKSFALVGFKRMVIIDMDTIELTNLNRQFLFRKKDIGRSKAEVAKEFVSAQLPHVQIEHQNCRLQDLDLDFQDQFDVIIGGLDNQDARSWLNKTVHDLCEFQPDGSIANRKLYIDGGTEGFKGQARVIVPFQTACFECTRDIAGKDNTKVPLCTLADTPRTPQHCILQAFIKLWEEQNPFKCKFDADMMEHVQWVQEKGLERGKQFNIDGIDQNLTLGTVKNIIPAVASTNETIASICVNEAFKQVTNTYQNMNNQYLISGDEGVYGNLNEIQAKSDCLVCFKDRVYVSQNGDEVVGDLFSSLIKEQGLSAEPQVCFDAEFFSLNEHNTQTLASLIAAEIIDTSGEILIIDANRKNALYIQYRVK